MAGFALCDETPRLYLDVLIVFRTVRDHSLSTLKVPASSSLRDGMHVKSCQNLRRCPLLSSGAAFRSQWTIGWRHFVGDAE